MHAWHFDACWPFMLGPCLILIIFGLFFALVSTLSRGCWLMFPMDDCEPRGPQQGRTSPLGLIPMSLRTSEQVRCWIWWGVYSRFVPLPIGVN